MKLVIDRSEVDKAIKEAVEDENLPKDFDRSKVKIDSLKAKVLEMMLDGEDEETIIRSAILELHGE